MKITTSSWFTPLPESVQKIGISRGTPRGYPAGYRKMPELNPGPWFRTASIPEYKQLYFEGLRALDPRKIVAKIEDLAAGKDAALLCYERPDDEYYCHRAYISCWLYDTLGTEVYEYGLEDEGCAWRHPKLPAQYRQSAKPDPLHVAPYIGATAADEQGHLWTVVGNNPDQVDQALIRSDIAGTRSISGDVLKSRFLPVT